MTNWLKMKRPSKNHPNPQHWQALREFVLQRQAGKCATCPDEAHDLHHHTYERFGQEQEGDVIFLCRLCHEAVTSAIRARRYAAGDRSPDLMDWMTTPAPEVSRHRPDMRPLAVSLSTMTAAPARFRPLKRNTEIKQHV